RNITRHQGRRGADNGQHVRVVLAIGAEHNGLDLDLVVPAFGKERPDGPVNEPGREDFLLGGAAFAFEVTAGEFAGGGGLFPIVHCQRKEVLAFFGFGGADGGDDDNGFAALDGDGAVGLFSDFAALDDDLLVPNRGGGFF